MRGRLGGRCAKENVDRKREMMKVKVDEGGMKTSESSVCRREGNMYFQLVERGMEQSGVGGCRKKPTGLKKTFTSSDEEVCRNSI